MILETELAPCVAYGFSFGPEFSTRVILKKNAQERRNANWAQPRHRGTAPFQNIPPEDFLEIKRVFMACRGMTYGFLFKDHTDWQATNEPLGLAPSGSAAVQLQKVSAADVVTFNRKITRPRSTGFTLYQADGSGNPVAKPGTLDITTGLFIPTSAWTAGRALSWSGEFRIPVRFNSDWLPFSYDELQSLNGSVEIIEVFGE